MSKGATNNKKASCSGKDGNNNESTGNKGGKQQPPAAAKAKPDAWLEELRDDCITDCHICGESFNCRRCATCHNRWYCSRQCQREDWSDHRQDCQMLGQLRSRCAFAERLGASYHMEDDQAIASMLPVSRSGMPALPHLILGHLVLSSEPGQVYLQTWATDTREKYTKIPIHVSAKSGKGIEHDIDTLLKAFQLLLGRTLEEAVKNAHGVAVQRCCLIDKVLVLSPVPTKPPSIYLA